MRTPNQKMVVAIIYICGMLMNSLDSTMVTVALATLSREFGVSPAATEGVVIGYIVSLAIFIPMSGWLGDRWGTKRTYLLALALFIGASALCGLATSLNQLILFRILQGAGGGLLTPVGMAMLYRAFPPQERVGVARVLMFATILGPACGPILGGFMIEHLSWRWAFYINLPIGLAALAFGGLFLHEHREAGAGKFDLPGFLLAGSSLAMIMYALSEGPLKGWGTPGILLPGLAGAALLLVFIFVELRVAAPMVQLRLLQNRLFHSTIIVSFFASSAFLGVLFLIPLYLQEARGISPLNSGLTTFPEALGVVASTQIVARIYPYIGPRRLMAGGLLWVATDITLLCLFGLEGSTWLIRILMFGLGVGMSYIFLPNQAAGFATISSADTGRASTLTNVLRQLGSASGVATLSTLLALLGPLTTTATGAVVPNIVAYRTAFFAAAGLALIGSLFALRVPDADAAITLHPTHKAVRASRPNVTAAIPEGD